MSLSSKVVGQYAKSINSHGAAATMTTTALHNQNATDHTKYLQHPRLCRLPGASLGPTHLAGTPS